MREDEFPHPVSDPEAEGLPGTADDDSSAWDDVDSGRIADGPDPGLLPGAGAGVGNRRVRRQGQSGDTLPSGPSGPETGVRSSRRADSVRLTFSIGLPGPPR